MYQESDLPKNLKKEKRKKRTKENYDGTAACSTGHRSLGLS